jgi:SAM-dependent methyltransferase
MTQSLRESLGIPSHVPEWLIYALLAQQAQKVAVIVDDRQVKIRENIRIAPAHSTESLLTACGYQAKDGIYSDFQGKDIVDIGGGFWGIAPKLSNSANQIIVVDPVFREKYFEALYYKDLDRLESNMSMKFDDKTPPSSELIRLRESNRINAEKVYQEFLWWKWYKPKSDKHKHIKRNSSYGEHLEWISDNSEDFVFVNYVLHKSTVKLDDFLSEVKRILKTGWCLIISEYQTYHSENSTRLEQIIAAIKKQFTLEENNFVENSNRRVIMRVYKQ